jgi:hypothetical protein
MSQATDDAEHLRLLSIFHYVVAGMLALFASFPIIHLIVGLVAILAPSHLGHRPEGALPPAFAGWFFVMFAGTWMLIGYTLVACVVVAGRSLAQRRRYLFCLVIAGVVAATCMPFGTVLGVFTIIVLMRPSVKELFGRASEEAGRRTSA